MIIIRAVKDQPEREIKVVSLVKKLEMYYGLIPLFLAPVFILWALYHLLVKKDLQKYRTEVFTGLTFIVVWAVIYIMIT